MSSPQFGYSLCCLLSRGTNLYRNRTHEQGIAARILTWKGRKSVVACGAGEHRSAGLILMRFPVVLYQHKLRFRWQMVCRI